MDDGDTDVTRYGWDVRNRLAEVSHFATFATSCGNSPDLAVDYLYDVENRWIGQRIDVDGNGQIDRTIGFAYDGNQIVLQFERDFESPLLPGEGQGEGLALTAADLSHRYLWQPDAVDQLMADEQLSPLPPGEGQGEGFDMSQPGSVVLPLGDHFGTIRDLAIMDSETGVTTVANHRVYDAYGNVKSQTNAAVDCLFGFTGRPFDENTGVNMSQSRPYEASTGRWVGEDWMAFYGRDTNTSRYCGNSPTNGSDPTGFWTIGSLFTQPVHEFITYQAALKAGWKLPEGSTEWSVGALKKEGPYFRFAAGLAAGVRWNDVPNGIGALTTLYRLDKTPNMVNILKLQNDAGYADTIASHFGNRQFVHGMTPHDYPIGEPLKLSAQELKQEIVRWICDQYENALTAKGEANKLAAPDQYHPPLGDTSPLEYDSGLALGKALHTLEDLYCPSHVWRSAGEVVAFQDYNEQDHDLHMSADTWLWSGAGPTTGTSPTWSPTTWANNKVQYGYQCAVLAAAQLLKYYDSDSDVDEVRSWLNDEVLVLEWGARNGGSDPDYKANGKTAGPSTALQTYWALA